MSRTRLAVVAVAVLLAAGLGIGLGVGLSGSSGQNAGVEQTAQLASVRLGCERWLGAAPAQPGTEQLCSDMTEWMSQYMTRYGSGPQMMWGDPGRLGSSCERWASEAVPTGVTSPRSWCNSMVAWMSNHMGSWSSRASWGDWMMRGPMMGG